MASEWDYDKNDILPTQITYGSTKKVHWKCKEGHSWYAKINSRTSHSLGCPYCGNKKILVGYNDLFTTHPRFKDEWDYEKNNILPTEVTFGSGKKVWWKCSKGHSWKSAITNRTQGSGCVFCYPKYSKSEKELLSIIKEKYDMYTVEENYKPSWLGRQEIDIYIIELNIGIEFNGNYWHDYDIYPIVKERDERKNKLCQENDCILITVWENDWNENKEQELNNIFTIIDKSKQRK